MEKPRKVYLALEVAKIFVGLSQLAVGVVSIIYVKKEENSFGWGIRYSGAPIWGGLLIISNAIHGICVYRKVLKINATLCNVCYLLCNLVLMFLLGLAGFFYAMNAASWKQSYDLAPDSSSTCEPVKEEDWGPDCDSLGDRKMGMVMSLLLTVITIISLLVQIISFLLAGIVGCCLTRKMERTVGDVHEYSLERAIPMQ